MAKKSAGVLLYRFKREHLEVFLVHPGGPFYAKKDYGVWSIPKGEFSDEEKPISVAKREFCEETGQEIDGEFLELMPVKQKSGKTVYAWAVEGELDAEEIRSNTFELEWPPKSGKKQEFAEVDRGEWFDVPMARKKIYHSQAKFIDELINKLKLTQSQVQDIQTCNSSQLGLF